MPAGRPSKYTPELGDRICALLAEGRSMVSICKQDDMPSRETIFAWIRKDPEFQSQYIKAKEESTDALFEELLDIADNGSNDWIEINDPENPGYRANGEVLNRSRLRVDVRKWALAKLKPKKYGDRVENVVSGSLDVNQLSDEQLNARIAELQKKAQV